MVHNSHAPSNKFANHDQEAKEQAAQLLRANAEKGAERKKEKEREKDKAQRGVSKIPKILPQQ